MFDIVDAQDNAASASEAARGLVGSTWEPPRTYQFPPVLEASTMMRQSVASSRSSHVPGQPPNATAMARLLEKKKEHEAVSAFERASGMFLKRIEGLADDCDIMADAGMVHGQVLAQWPQMFRILNTYLASRAQSAEDNLEEPSPLAAGERLVRVPIEELQPTGHAQSES
ncbi:hypothetical protein EW146_g6820 [Bondarzewia mesenterica]|uniref:DASH complex subunit DAD2 n=1 Tax=Bondarzewia mesenterica TaxID=1095465 RepID=A0A4S4LN92_9AGAM|nr:hypothetical protein EW146_g6820 [Bondarzewia mesenterica]